jgi:hypothetical protein
MNVTHTHAPPKKMEASEGAFFLIFSELSFALSKMELLEKRLDKLKLEAANFDLGDVQFKVAYRQALALEIIVRNRQFLAASCLLEQDVIPHLDLVQHFSNRMNAEIYVFQRHVDAARRNYMSLKRLLECPFSSLNEFRSLDEFISEEHDFSDNASFVLKG